MVRVEASGRGRGGGLAASLLLLSACGGGGGGGGGAGVAAAVTIDFPPVGCVTDAGTVTARGRTAGISRIQALEVNGFPATSPDAFRTWSGLTIVDAGNDVLVAEAVRRDGGRIASEPLAIRREPPLFTFLRGLAYDDVDDRLLVVDHETLAILAHDRGSEERELVVPPATFSAGEIVNPIDVVFDGSRGRLLILENASNTRFTSRITAVDLLRGARAVLTSDTIGSGPAFDLPVELAYDSSLDLLLVIDSRRDALFHVDPVTGDRKILSDSTTGSGPAIQAPQANAIDSLRNRALVAETRLNAVLTVDLKSGDRTILSDAQNGAGIDFGFMNDIALDVANDRLLVHDAIVEAVLAVDLQNGDREVVVDESSGLPIRDFSAQLVVDSKGVLAYFSTGRTLFEVDLAANQARDLFGPVMVGQGQRFDGPSCVLRDPDSGDLLVLDGDPLLLIRVDRSTGDRSVAAGPGVGSGPGFFLAGDAAIDVPSRRALVLSSLDHAIVAVDRGSGDRSELYGPTRGAGSPFEGARAIAADAAGTRCFVLDQRQPAPGSFESIILSVDLASGGRTIVSGEGRGAGPTATLVDLALDAARGRLVCTSTAPSLLTIDVVTGDRAVLTDATIDDDPALERPGAVEIAPDGERALVVDSLGGSFFALLAVDLESGEGAVLSDCNGAAVGFGPLFRDATRFAIDELRGVAFLFEDSHHSIMAVDLESGDRVIRSK